VSYNVAQPHCMLRCCRSQLHRMLGCSNSQLYPMLGHSAAQLCGVLPSHAAQLTSVARHNRQTACKARNTQDMQQSGSCRIPLAHARQQTGQAPPCDAHRPPMRLRLGGGVQGQGRRTATLMVPLPACRPAGTAAAPL
jgi:hypothetical protein